MPVEIVVHVYMKQSAVLHAIIEVAPQNDREGKFYIRSTLQKLYVAGV